MWAARAFHELRNSERTWFATLTIRPEQQYRFIAGATARRAKRGVIDKMSADEEFRSIVMEAGKEVTLGLKRLRKHLGVAGAIRYILVAEPHKSGLPHFHMLIHESGKVPVRHADLECYLWDHGFTKFKLIRDTIDSPYASWYVVKYLGKANSARVRASIGYGRSPTAPTLSESESVKSPTF